MSKMKGWRLKYQRIKDYIYYFFENPKSFFGLSVKFGIIFLIFVSIVFVIIEQFYNDIFKQYKFWFLLGEYIILTVFTIEYALRLLSAPKKWPFIKRPLNIFDLLAIIPTYIEFICVPLFGAHISIFGIKILRLLRFGRILRVFKLFRHQHFLIRTLRYQGTILESITPIIFIFSSAKIFIWILEARNFWIMNADLGELFTIIGFALGIILSQQIGVTYDKFLRVEEASMRLYGSLSSLELIINKIKPDLGTKICSYWAKAFLQTLKERGHDNQRINAANFKLYEAVQGIEKAPAEMATMHAEILRDAAFCLSKKTRITPKAYDTLLNQAIMLYFILAVAFIPGITGLVSIIVATYILYGMYHVTQDMDSIVGGDFNLINIDISELEHFAERPHNFSSKG